MTPNFILFLPPIYIAEIKILRKGTAELIVHNEIKYQKLRATPYRSYWHCLTLGCSAYLILKDLKGGQLVKCKTHNAECFTNNSYKQ